MGLSERFKESLDKRNIFKKLSKNSEGITAENYMSNPVSAASEMENLETKIISKIRNTPYWKEFSTAKKEQMIASYFDSKNPAAKISCKNEFINNIIELTK